MATRRSLASSLPFLLMPPSVVSGIRRGNDEPSVPLEQQEPNETRGTPARASSSIILNEVVSQAEALETWDGILRREGAIYSKVVSVQAKCMSEKGFVETMVDGQVVQTQRSYDKGDYVIRGSRQSSTGVSSFYPMNRSDFSVRYHITSSTDPASDPMLEKAGFRLFKSKGKAWCHRLAPNELSENFPRGRFFGKCT